MRNIFLFATELEAQQFRAASPHASIVICGVGGAQCAATAAEVILECGAQRGEVRLVLAGIAGTYSTCDVAIGEVVEVVEESLEALPERFGKLYRSQPLTQLRGVSSNTVNASGGDGSAECKAQIEQMEGAHFVAMCERLGVEHLQVRAISNRVGDPFPMWRVEQACGALSRFLEEWERRAQ